jgi:rhodanese-related sulfurtransferase
MKAIYPTNRFLILLFFTFPAVLFSQSIQTDTFIRLGAEDFIIQMKLSQNEVLIDVRTKKEFKQERIPNALSASSSEILYSMTDTLDLEQPIFIYCEEESRSLTACSLLMERGFKHVYMLNDGILGWKKKKLNIDDSRIKHKRSSY